jgi:hypothetical protein
MQRTFSVIEQLAASGKGEPARCEDRLVVSDDFVAVIDGATSSGPIGDRAGGIVAAEAVAEVLQKLAADATVHDFVLAATSLIARRIGVWDDTRMRPSAAAVVWSAARREIWRIGDCLYRVDDLACPGTKEIDVIAYAYRCAVVRGRLRLGRTSPEAERRVPTLEQPFMPLIDVQHAFMNLDDEDEPLAYGALCGTPVPERFVEVRPVADAREIVLCSDGFLSPAPTLAEIAATRDADPLMVRRVDGSRPFPPGADYFDDTTYVRFRIG